MGLDRIFGESVRELADGESKCFQVIPADTKAIKVAEADAGRVSHIEIGGGRILLENCGHEDGYVVIPLHVNARFAQIVLSADYLASCERKKFIVGTRTAEDGAAAEETVEVGADVTDVAALDSATFKGAGFKTIVRAMMPSLTLVSK